MVNKVVDSINLSLKELKFFTKVYGICEIITDQEKYFPAYYSNKKYTSVLDSQNSFCYHRLNGSISITNAESETTSCGSQSTKRYPMRLVFIIKKDLCNYGVQFESDILNTIEKAISFQSNALLQQDLGAVNVSVSLTSSTFERDVLSNSEFRRTNKVGYEYVFMAIDYSIEVISELNCQQVINC
jgi:hypothetical protein